METPPKEGSRTPFTPIAYFDEKSGAPKSVIEFQIDKLAIEEVDPPLSTTDNDRFYLNYVRNARSIQDGDELSLRPENLGKERGGCVGACSKCILF